MDTNLFMQNLQNGLTVTVIGMLSVLFFLSIMIFAMGLMEKIIVFINKKFPAEIKEEPNKKDKKQTSNDEEIAVIVAAIMAKNA